MSAGRRNLLTGVAAAALVPAAGIPATTSPDAEVIRIAQAVVDAEKGYRASFVPPPQTLAEEEGREAEQDRLPDLSVQQADALADLPAATLAGVVAKARAALAAADMDQDGRVIAPDYVHQLAYDALEDLVRVAGGAA